MSIAQIIKYEGDNSTFVWKHPSEDFNTSTQLIVHESQEAIFFMNGQALDLFGAGRYTLETENIPLIRKVTNLPTGGQTPFHCEVYFINKTEQMAIRWGTDSKVQYLEPTYKFPISIGASGEMSLSVSDSRKLLIKLVGTEAFLGQAKLIQFFRAFLMTRVKTYIAQTMAANAINIFEADSIAAEDSKDKAKTGSPWIYSELLMATEFPHRTWASYRETLQHGLRKDDKMLEFAQELKVKYEAPIEELNDLSFSDLQPDKLGKKAVDPLHTLDTLYKNKGIVI